MGTCTAIVQTARAGKAKVENVLFWNLNGLRARWKGAKLSLQEVVRHQAPDVVVLAESRTDHEQVLKLKGFEDWVQAQGYFYSYFYWTVEEGKRKFGEGGMTVLSKIKPLDVKFGLGDLVLDKQARVINVLFDDLVVVGTFNPQGGFTDSTLAMKTTWERALGRHIANLRVTPEWSSRKFVWVGDLNVNPHRDDWSDSVWDHLQRKLQGRVPGGCREIDVSTYQHNVGVMESICASIFSPIPRDPRLIFVTMKLEGRGLGNVLIISLWKNRYWMGHREWE